MFKFKKKKLPLLTEILISDILPPLQKPRRYFEITKLDELSRSIRRYGVLQPILVRPLGKKYEIIAGERRLRAASLAGLRRIPSIVMNMSDSDAAAAALIENMQRENLSFLDESGGMRSLAENECMSVSNLAYMLSVTDETVEQKLRFEKLPVSVKKAILYNKITEEQAKQIMRLDDEETMLKVAKKIALNGYDTSQTRELVEKILLSEMPVLQPNKKYKGGDLRLIRNTLNKTVDIMKRSGMRAKASERDEDGCYEYTIKVEKAN